MMPRYRSAVALLVVAVAVVTGCGGAAKSAAEPEAQAQAGLSQLGDVDSTLADMDRAEADLAQALGDPPGAASSTAPNGDTPAPGLGPAGAAPTTPAAPAQPQLPMAPPKAEAKSNEDEAGSCNIAKRALGSLQRSAEHLCGLTGESDPRCDTARGRAQRAAARVGAACPP